MAGDDARLEYTAQVESASLSGEVSLSITPDGLNVISLFQPVFVAFKDVVAISRPDYLVVVVTTTDRFSFAHLGTWRDGFYLALLAGFNAKVRRALFLAGQPSFAADGDFGYSEDGTQAGGQATVELYDDCLALLPPDDRARRVPLVCVTELRAEAFGLTLGLDGGDWYTVTRLGRSADDLVAAVKQKLVALRQRGLEAVRALDASLAASQVTAIAARMPPGVALPAAEVATMAPSYLAAIEQRIARSRAAQTYVGLAAVCPPGDICLGLKPAAGADQPADCWFIAPSASQAVAAVEWALAPTEDNEAAATYFYASGDDRAGFARRFNRAMAAIDFHREVVTAPVDQLNQPGYDHYAMAVRRTPALAWLRHNLVGRVVHASMSAWTAGMTRLMT